MIYVTIPEGWVFIPARAILKDRALSTSTPDEPRSASVGISDRAGTGECPEIPDHPIESI